MCQGKPGNSGLPAGVEDNRDVAAAVTGLSRSLVPPGCSMAKLSGRSAGCLSFYRYLAAASVVAGAASSASSSSDCRQPLQQRARRSRARTDNAAPLPPPSVFTFVPVLFHTFGEAKRCSDTSPPYSTPPALSVWKANAALHTASFPGGDLRRCGRLTVRKGGGGGAALQR